MVEFSGKSPTVLVVEDDPYVLSFMESSLALSGFHVLSARTYAEAMVHCREAGLDNLWAILCDYRLPDNNGLELLRWVRSEDSTLSTLIITGQGEKSIVQESLALGVFQYLEKPVTHQDLRKILRDAVSRTSHLRQSERDRKGLEALEQFDQRISGAIPPDLRKRVQVFYQPLHEVGGDFFISHRYSSGEWVLLVGDVSGHDIKSGYVSTYFQGMFRGCVANGSRVQEFLQLFNHVLRHQGITVFGESDLISLSLSAFYINFAETEICHWNFGAVPCYLVCGDGRIHECHFGKPPLGWLENIDVTAEHLPVNDKGSLFCFTDGLVELAGELEVNMFGLIHKLMDAQNSIYSLRKDPKDDILAIKYTFNPDLPLNAQFNPILSEHYAGTEVEQIDHLQSNWRRSLTFALDDNMGDRLYDLLICIREGMLNALVHGCEKASDKFAHLQISLRGDKEVIRVVIDDPGRGHDFDLKKRLDQINAETGKHLGLGIIQHLSDDFRIENKGTSLVFDFEIKPVHA